MPKGVLLVNLGSPDSFAIKDIKRYLKEFLMDERVIDLPYLLRYALVHGVILNTRPPKTSKAYQKIWWSEGSPLIVISRWLTEKVQRKVSVPVVLAMRYGNPNIANALKELHSKGVDEVLLLILNTQWLLPKPLKSSPKNSSKPLILICASPSFLLSSIAPSISRL